MFGRRLLYCCVALTAFIPNAFGQMNVNAYNTIDQIVRRQSESGIKQFKQKYGTLDYTDSYGQTPLCTAIHRNDYIGYLILARNGASRQHRCIQQIPVAQKTAFNQRYKSYMASLKYRSGNMSAQQSVKSGISPVWWGVGGAAGLGIAVAAIAGGGGGGGSGSSSSSNGNVPEVTPKPTTVPNPTITPTPTYPSYPTVEPTPTAPTLPTGITTPTTPTLPTGSTTPTTPTESTNPSTPTTPTVLPLTAKDFETSEYTEGNFLDAIKAADAYAQLYTKTKNTSGEVIIKHNLEPVTVAVIDSGVNKNNDLNNKLLTGYNFDYGPCSSSNSKNCWTFKTEYEWWDILKENPETGKAFVDANGNTSDIVYPETQQQYNQWKAKYAAGYTWNKYDTTPNPNAGGDIYHGTHVSGIIAAEKNDFGMHGVAPNASIYPIKYDFLSGITNPLKIALSAKAKVINYSVGVPVMTDEDGITYDATLANNDKTKPLYAQLMSYNLEGFQKLGTDKKAVFVAAAGNSSHSQPSLEAGAGLYYSDIGLNEVMIVVVNVNPDNNYQLSDKSNQCGATKEYCMAAPGMDIKSTYGAGDSYDIMSGTSMAAPVVSGAAALLWGAYPDLTATDVTEILFDTAIPLDGQELSTKYGHGLLNVYDAINKPLGIKTMATTASISGERIPLSGTQLAIPRVMAQVMAQMPVSVSILDKYNRSFPIAISSLIHTNERDSRIFQNQLHRFMKFDTIHQFHDENSPMSFSFSTASKKDSQYGIGAMDVTYQFVSNKMRFYFTEDSLYGNGEFFDKVTLNPFSAMEEAYGFENTYTFNKSIDFNFGFATGRNALFKTNEDDEDEAGRLTSFQGGISYKPFKKITFQMTGGALNEEESLLGLRGSGAFDIKTSRTYYMGLSAATRLFKNLTLTGSYYYGMTPAQKLNAFTQTNRLYSESFALDARWHMTPTNYFGAFVSSPLRIKQGNLKYKLPNGRDYYSDTVYFNEGKASLAGTKREWDTGIYGTYALTPNIRMKAQTGVRFYPEHQADAQPDYQVLFGLDWKWD